MISRLRGTLAENGNHYAVIDCGGVGYYAALPANSSHKLPAVGQECILYTILNITKTDVSLIGFFSQEQLDCFRLITSVSGVGTKLGLEIIGSISVSQIKQALITENVNAFTSLKGVGKKIAQRIILDCKDKAEALFSSDVISAKDSDATLLTAAEALVSLGYNRKDALSAVSGLDSTLPLEKLISEALKRTSII